MSAAENGSSSSKDDDGDPPPLSIKLMELSDLPKTSKPSSDVQLPVDMLLLTVEECEFLACHHYLQNTFRSYFQSFGYAYFGDMGDNHQKPLKVALVKCSKGSSDPGSSLIVAKNAVTQLRPKVTFSVGHCRGLNPEKAKLGDVVISSKLTTDVFRTPVSRDVGNLVRNAADGWKVPLENAEGEKVKVHCDGEILSCPDAVSAEQQCKFHLGAIAVEMEGKGIFAAAHDMKSEWVVVKGVSHFADTSTHESWKMFACVMAASLVSNMLCDPYVFEQWPHFEDIPAHEERSKSHLNRESPCSSDSPDAKQSRLSVQPTEQHMKDMNEQQELYHYEDHGTWLKLVKRNWPSFRNAFIYNEQQTDQQRMRINLFVARFQDHFPTSYVCNSCRVELSGRRYRCLNCMDVDFCHYCYMAGKKTDGHTESHDVIEVRYKCAVCKGFILGAQFCCYKCQDFFLCIVCKSRHPADHQVTQFPIKKEPLAEECEKQLQSHYNTFSKIKMIPWDQSSAIHINDIYTQLSWVRDDRRPSGVTQEKLEDYTDIFKGDKRHPNPKRILVYGRPGIGKSTFSKKASFDWSQQEKMILMRFHLVLLIKLRDVRNVKDIRGVLKASKLLPADGVISIDDVFDYVLRNQEKVLLILDGYDEYSCAGELSPVRDIWESALLRDCHVIITTRHLKVDELKSPSHVQFEINGFKSEGQVKAFARKFLKDKDVDEFVKDLEEKNLKEMAEIPLLLLMLCLLWKENHRIGLEKSRAGIYLDFIQTLMNHLIAKDADAKQFKKVDDYKEELYKLGKLAFDALLRDCLSFPFSELPNDILSTKLIEFGLCHVLNDASLTPKKVVDFIHKSLQEFLAAFYLKEELLKEQSTSCLSEVDSFKKIVKMIDVLKFACELSAEAACAVLSHLGMIGKKDGLTEYEFSKTPSEEEFTEDQRQFLTLISNNFFCCKAEKRRDLYSMFLSYTGGVLLINSDQLHSVANEHLLKSAAMPEYIFFQYSDRYSEQSYRDLITVLEDVNAVVVSCSGEKNASDFLKKYPFCSACEFFLKKEEKMNLYINTIKTFVDVPFPTEMLKELISSPESTQKKKQPVGDQSNEQDNRTALCLTDNNDSTTGQPRHCLSCVYFIKNYRITSQEMETLIEVLPFVPFPQHISISGEAGAAELAETLTETLVSHNFTNRLKSLTLGRINLTARAAGVIARSLHQAPNLRYLTLSVNPLGKGVSDLTRHLSDVPDLEALYLSDVKMTKKQVNELTKAVRRSKISTFWSSYHDEKGNLKPEHKWPKEDHWKMWCRSEDELDSGSSSTSTDGLEPGMLTESEDELEPGTSV